MAELFLSIHFLFILFLAVGFPVGLIVNNRIFRYIHAALLGFVTLLMILGIPCPLTTLEESAGDVAYAGSFLAVWLRRIVYLTWFEPRHVFILDIAFAVLVFSSFFWRPVRNKRNQ